MRTTLAIIFALILTGLIVIGAAGHTFDRASDSTPDGAVKNFFALVKSKDFDAAYLMVAPESGIDKWAFIRDVGGNNGSLKTVSELSNAETKVLDSTDARAKVRTRLQWSTAVGAMNDERDLELVKNDSNWRIVWPKPLEPNTTVRTSKTEYLRWDVVARGDSEREWGAQNVEPPRMRVISMNAIQKDGAVIILGEVVNEDTVPGFVTIDAALIGKDGQVFAQESSFDKISHTLLPKEVSPFRVDFPNTKLTSIKSVRLNPTTLLVPAYADPVIGVAQQKLEKDANGHAVLSGMLVNESGTPINIPHVLATYYDNAGRVIWVSDGYVQSALLPNSPVPFAVSLRDDVAPNVNSYRVTVNHYSSDRS
jgi:hypothetical protein